MERGRLHGLDALRGIAALIVLFYHAAGIFHFDFLFERGLLLQGRLAVDFFFMLSGYVIARMLDGKERRPLAFIWSRYRRFWPTMAVGTAFGLCAYALQPDPAFNPWLAGLAGFALIPTPAAALIFPLNSPTWSIYFELFANAVHSIMPSRAWPAVFVGCLAMVVYSGGFVGGPTVAGFGHGFARVLVAYSLGVMLFRWWRDKPPFKVPASCGAALFIALLPVGGHWFDYCFVLVICPLVLASGLGPAKYPRVATTLGSLSFPLYAVHFPILMLAEPLGFVPAMALALGVAWAVAVAGNHLSHRVPAPRQSARA